MKHFEGDLFTSDAPALGHGVNCDGVMGAGIAKGFKYKFPDNYRRYRRKCLEGHMHPGNTLIHKEKDIWVVNMASQDRPGPNATYRWLWYSAMDAANSLLYRDVTRLAIPEIGSGIGGLSWYDAQHLLESVEILNPHFEFEVWHYEG